MNLSIKNVPEDIVVLLRERARGRHRSLQGELLAIVEAAAHERQPSGPREVLAKVRGLGLRTPAETVSIVRSDRDRR